MNTLIKGLFFPCSLRKLQLHQPLATGLVKVRNHTSALPPSVSPRKTFEENNQSSEHSMDGFLENIRHHYKVKADTTIKKQHRKNNQEHLSRTTRLPHSLAPLDRPTGAFVSYQRENKLDLRDCETALSLVVKADDEGKSFPPKDLVAFASIFSQHGQSKGVQTCQKLMAEHCEYEFNSEMHLDHYMAGALWMEGQLEESVNVFKRLFYDYPLRRKKIGDVFRFAILRSIAQYPCPEQMVIINEFVDFCADLQEYRPAVYLWRALFENPVPAAHKDASEILSKYPKVTNLLPSQLDSLVRKARTAQDPVTLWRLLQLLEQLDLPAKDLAHYAGCFFDSIVEIYCRNEDAAGAQEVLSMASDHATKNNYRLWPESAKRLNDVLNLRQKKLPVRNFVIPPKPKSVNLKF